MNHVPRAAIGTRRQQSPLIQVKARQAPDRKNDLPSINPDEVGGDADISRHSGGHRVVKNILLADGDHRVAEAVADILDQDGVLTTWVPDLGHALAALGRAAMPDLLLLDYRLRGDNGFQALTAAVGLQLPFCILTGDRAIADLMRMHCVPVLKKPFDAAALRQAIGLALLHRHETTTQLAQLRYFATQLGAAASRTQRAA